MVPPFSFGRRRIAAVILWRDESPVAAQETVRSQEPSDPAAITHCAAMIAADTYYAAMKAFQEGRYSEAADGLSKVLSSVTDP